MTLSKRYVWSGAVAAVIATGLIVGAIRPNKSAQAAPGIVPEVQVVSVEHQDVPIYAEWIGTLDGLVDADVRAQATGYLLKQGYQEGAFVKRGQLLFQIDPRPFHAALDEAGSLRSPRVSAPAKTSSRGAADGLFDSHSIAF
jgi:multidrug efflux pump subunit AcrA (membrane-fusion protein)